MLKTRIAKIAGITAGAALAFGTLVPVAGAVTVAELQAQINALMAQLASLSGGTTVSTGASITSDLTIGSSGAQVSALQSALVSGGYLVMPAGVSMGYFGSLTKAAVMKWQAANGVPATGYFGPISRAKFNGSMGATGTVPGTTVGGSTSGGGITTPGVEGSVTVSVNPSPSTGTKLYEGEAMKQVMGIKLEAKTSDIKIERIKVDLDCVTCDGSDNDVYRKIANKIYVMDGSNVLGSMALNSSTVVEDGTDRFITVSGLSYVVPAGATRVLYLALDANSTWDSDFDNDAWTLGIPVDGVRGVDGAGVNQYGPSTAFTREFTSAAELASNASLAISLASNSPVTNQIICEGGSSNNECDELEIMKASFKAEKDDVQVTDLVLSLTRTNNTTPTTSNNVATATTAYLYDGSTLVGSASTVASSATVASATFSDIDWTVSKDTTKVLSVKLDIDSAQLAADTYYVAITSGANVTAENSLGDNVGESGSATSKVFTIRKVGPQVSLVGSPSISTSGVPQSDTSTNLSTSTMTAIFNVKIKAVGGDITLGTVASGTPTFASSTASFKVFRNGAYDATISAGATSTSYSIGNTCVTGSLTNSCTLSEGTEVTVPVTFSIIGRTVLGVSLTRGSVYSVQFTGIQWFNSTTGAVQTTTFMSGENDWRSSDVSFP